MLLNRSSIFIKRGFLFWVWVFFHSSYTDMVNLHVPDGLLSWLNRSFHMLKSHQGQGAFVPSHIQWSQDTYVSLNLHSSNWVRCPVQWKWCPWTHKTEMQKAFHFCPEEWYVRISVCRRYQMIFEDLTQSFA